jgi:hypothetical protein
MMEKALLSFCIPIFITLAVHAQNPVIQAVNPSKNSVLQFEKLEISLSLEAMYDNPYDFDQINVQAIFTGPEGRELSVDGFYMEDFELNPDNGAMTPAANEGSFRIRFAPDKTGLWSYTIRVTDQHGTVSSEPQTFTCQAGTHKGYVRSNPTNYLQFDNGEQYIPVGENIAWHNNNAFLDYQQWLTALSDNGGNFFRLWHAHWGLGIEWRQGWNAFAGLRRYKEINMAYQDWLFDFCADRDIYVMFCLQHHGQVATQVNPNWSDSPYNAANGGPCQNTWDFFTNEAAKAHTKNRLRYIVARWGYARSIMAWELFNEVGWTDNYEQHRQEIADWHTEMSAYLKSIDPYQHLVTTSFADESQDPMVWATPDIDFTQTHYYLNVSNIEKALVKGIAAYLEDYGKPTLTGEYGLGGSPVLAAADPDGIHIHNAMWATLFGGGLGTGMSWWWDSYIHPRNLYYHFAPMSSVAEQIPYVERDLRPVTSYVSGASGDLSLSPSLGWAGIGTDTIFIDEKGQINPSDAGLGIYLYGSQWNTQFRSPPTFVATFPENGTFTVYTNNETGTNPRITIHLNGEQVVDQGANPGKSYTIDVPAGPNIITVDNTGTDWITIAAYEFSGLGSKIDSYVLRSEDRDLVAGWVLNQEYNHVRVIGEGVPEAVSGGVLQIEDVNDGSYSINWYDCLSGDVVRTESATAENGLLQILLPGLYWDLAFVADGMPTRVREEQEPLSFKLYPNPARVGEEVSLKLPDGPGGQIQYSLYDAQGRPLQSGELATSTQEVNLKLPTDLAPGWYWLQLRGNNRMGTRPIAVVR